MKEHLIKVYNVLNDLFVKEGLVPSGEFQFVKPNKPGLVDLEVQINPGPIGKITIITKRKVQPLGNLEPTNLKQMGYTGNTCRCGSARMVRRGSCEYCEDCGESSGCS